MCFEQNLVPVGSCTTSRRNPLFRALSRIRERSVAFELAFQLSRARRRAVKPSRALYSHPSSALSLSHALSLSIKCFFSSSPRLKSCKVWRPVPGSFCLSHLPPSSQQVQLLKSYIVEKKRATIRVPKDYVSLLYVCMSR